LEVGKGGAVVAVQEALWRLVEGDVVQAILAPLQTHSREAPAPTLIKKRERLTRANPLASVLPFNSAKIARLLLAQAPVAHPELVEGTDDDLQAPKRLAAVLRPCEARALDPPPGNLLMVSVDCLEICLQREAAPHHLRRACQVCAQPYFDQAHIVIGLLGQDIGDQVLVLAGDELAAQICPGAPPAPQDALERRQQAIRELAVQRREARQRLLDEIQAQDLYELLAPCTLCGACLEACPLSPKLDVHSFEGNTPRYVAARLQSLALQAEQCAGCGACDDACPQRIPLLLLARLFAERPQARQAALKAHLY
jgi:Pyruvate/2-oxoacid:ferredoxin oxidoreductase delta subunit